MDEELLRDEIYKRLGVEKGSLTSESGNDWQRAKDEILSEYKENERKKHSKLKEINYSVINKDTEEFQSVLSSSSYSVQDYKVVISHRSDLTEDEILKLIESGNKEVIINLTRWQTLSSQAITNILPNSVYLTKKNLIEKQSLSEDHKAILLNLMKVHPETYANLLEKLR